MELLLQLSSGFVIGLIAAVSPGPDTILVLRSVVSGGARAGARAALGIGAALALHALGTLVMILVVRDVAGTLALKLIQLAGAVYLAYLGVTLLRSAFTENAASGDADAAKSGTRYFVHGFVTNVTNPKAIVFFTSVVSQFITGRDIESGATVLLGVVAAVPTWFVFLSYLSAHFIGGLPARGRRIVDWVAGFAFIGLACVGIVAAIQQ